MTRESASKTKILMEITAGEGAARPMGAVGIDESGQLFRKNEDGIYNFTFAYMGYTFAVRAEAEPGHTRMRIHALLGNVPYSAESPSLRVNMMAVAEAAGRALGGRIHVNREQRVLYFDEFHFDETLTPQALMTKSVAFLLSAKPYLEILNLIASATRAIDGLLPPPADDAAEAPA